VWSRTLRGRFFNLLGYILSVYGVYRVVMAMVNIVLKRDPTKDPVTMLFEVRRDGAAPCAVVLVCASGCICGWLLIRSDLCQPFCWRALLQKDCVLLSCAQTLPSVSLSLCRSCSSS